MILSKKTEEEKTFIDFLTDFDVQFVSLVDHGGNRAPFKIVRLENGMKDVIQSILVPKDVDLNTLKENEDLAWIHGVSISSVDEYEKYKKYVHMASDRFDPKSLRVERLDDGAQLIVGTLISPDPKAVIYRAQWTSKFKDSLPDTSFAVVETGYEESRSTARHLPFKDKDGKVDVSRLETAWASRNEIKSVLGNDTDEELRIKAEQVLEPYVKQFLPEAQTEERGSLDTLMQVTNSYSVAFGELVYEEWNKLGGVVFNTLDLENMENAAKVQSITSALDSFKTFITGGLETANKTVSVRFDANRINLTENLKKGDSKVTDQNVTRNEADLGKDLIEKVPALVEKILSEKEEAARMEKEQLEKDTQAKAEVERRDQTISALEEKLRTLEERLAKFETDDSDLGGRGSEGDDREARSETPPKTQEKKSIWSGSIIRRETTE